jgi:hypothetical protein
MILPSMSKLLTSLWHDTFIMQRAKSLLLKPKELLDVNLVRIYLQVTTVSDMLANEVGTKIPRNVWDVTIVPVTSTGHVKKLLQQNNEFSGERSYEVFSWRTDKVKRMNSNNALVRGCIHQICNGMHRRTEGNSLSSITCKYLYTKLPSFVKIQPENCVRNICQSTTLGCYSYAKTQYSSIDSSMCEHPVQLLSNGVNTSSSRHPFLQGTSTGSTACQETPRSLLLSTYSTVHTIHSTTTDQETWTI